MSEQSTSSRRPLNAATLVEKFPRLFVEIIGDKDRVITGVAAPETAVASSAVFLATPKALASGLKSLAQTVVVSKKNRDEALRQRGERTVLVAPNVELAMALTTNEFFRATPFRNPTVQGIHATATVHPSAVLASNVSVGPHAFIGARVRLAENVYVGPNSVIEDDCEIGANTVIHPLVYIGHSTLIGQRCEIHPSTVIGKEGYGYVHDEKGNHYKIPHQGRVILEDDVHVGAVSAIDRSTFNETRIGAGTKIDNTVHIAHNCSVGRNGLITAGFIVAGSTKIGANFVSGGNATVTGHLEICDNVQIAGFGGVSKNLTKPGPYGGYPLQPLRDFLKTKAAIVQLARMRKQLKRISKHLGMEEESEAEAES